MIVCYGGHAANERTFLAWVRTGIAVIVFGFAIEKFNLFVRVMAKSSANSRSADICLRSMICLYLRRTH